MDLAVKPLFYMLAQHGPWNHHVEIFGSMRYFEVVEWLSENGYRNNVAYEVIEPSAGVGTKKGMLVDKQKLKFIILFNDSKLATYVKTVWG